MLKVNHESNSKAKLFTGGKPKDFRLLPERGTAWGVVCALQSGGKTYSFNANGAFDSAAIREIGQHFNELADIMEEKAA